MTAPQTDAIGFLVVLIVMSPMRRSVRWAMGCVARALVVRVAGTVPYANLGMSPLHVESMERCVAVVMTQIHARLTLVRRLVVRTPILEMICPAVWARFAMAESAAWDAGWGAHVSPAPAEPLAAAAVELIAVPVSVQAMTVQTVSTVRRLVTASLD